MKNLLNKMVHKAKTTLSQTTDHMKERMYTVTGTSSASVKQIADYIQNHPDTFVKKKHLLGFTFSFSEVEVDGIQYYLEMKNSYILQLDVHTANGDIVSYRSYRDHYSLNTPMKFPELSY